MRSACSTPVGGTWPSSSPRASPPRARGHGAPRRGLGILGLLVEEPRPLRIPDLRRHPASQGFPPGHPPMRSFLGAPIRVRGEVFGNLYLTGEDRRRLLHRGRRSVLVALAAATGVAIDNARRYGAAHRERQWADAVSDISQALLDGQDDLAALDLVVVERAMAVAEAAMSVVAVVDDSDDLAIRAAVGPDRRLSQTAVGSILGSSHWREVLETGQSLLLVSHPGGRPPRRSPDGCAGAPGWTPMARPPSSR